MNIVHIPEEIRSEFSVDEQGLAFASRSAIARLCGLKSHKSISYILKNIAGNKSLSKPLQPFATQDFQAWEKLPDILVAAVLTHYAWKGYEPAQEVCLAFTAIGIRTWIQQELGWSDPLIPQLESKMVEYDRKLEALKNYQDDLVQVVSHQSQADRRYQEQKLKEFKEYIDRYAHRVEPRLEELERREEWLKSIAGIRDFRAKINIMVTKYCERNDIKGGIVYNYLYSELYKVSGYDARERADKLQVACIEACAIDGVIDQLWSLARSLL